MRILTAMGLVLLLFISTVAGAAQSALLNNITYQIRAQQWVKTDRVLLTVAVNLTASEQNIVSMKKSIMKNLKKITPGDWHLTCFDRNKTSSGLQSVNAQAQVRLDASQLSELDQRVSHVSRAGQTYRIQSMNFQPDLADRQATQNSLRATIYKSVQAELKRLNTVYPKQRYFLHQIQFLGVGPMLRTMALMKVPNPSSNNVSVSQQITMTANVTLSSTVSEK